MWRHLSRIDWSMRRSKAIVVVFWTVTAFFCLPIGFTAYAQPSLPKVAEALTRLGFADYLRVELSLAKLLGVPLLLRRVLAKLKEWASFARRLQFAKFTAATSGSYGAGQR